MERAADALRAAGFVDVEAIDLTPRVLQSTQHLAAVAGKALLAIRLERAVDEGAGAGDAVYEGHVRGAVAQAEGLLFGAMTYGSVRGRRPARP